MDKFLPVLKSAEWAAQASLSGVVVRPLRSLHDEDMPYIAYGIDQEDTVAYLQENSYVPEETKKIIDGALPLLRRELANIKWTEIRVQQSGFSLRYLAFTDHFKAAECLLLEERLLEAHSLLDAERLLVCTPQRGMLLAFHFNPAEPAFFLETFFDVCNENYSMCENEPISPAVWVVEDGGIVRRFEEGLGDAVDQNDHLATINISSCLEHDSAEKKPSREIQKIFTVTQIVFVTLFGTFLAGFYAVAKNYKQLGCGKEYLRTIVTASIVIPMYFLCFVFLPRSPYDRLFPIGAALVFGLVVMVLQKDSISEALRLGARKQSVSTQVVVIIISLIVTLPLLAAAIYYML